MAEQLRSRLTELSSICIQDSLEAAGSLVRLVLGPDKDLAFMSHLYDVCIEVQKEQQV